MPIKLYYFNIKGLAELPRLILHAANVDFEDIRLTQEEWPEYKPKMPLEKVPVLFDEDFVLPESGAIVRYLAHKYNLAGKCDKEKAKVDAVLIHISFFGFEVGRILYHDESGRKEENLKKLKDEEAPLFLCNLSKLMKMFGSDGHFVGKELTVADIAFFALVDNYDSHLNLDMSKYPELKTCIEKVKNVSGIQKYLASRQ